MHCGLGWYRKKTENQQPFLYRSVYTYNAFITSEAGQTSTFKPKMYENW